MRPILKGFHSDAIIQPLSEYFPEDEENFGFWARIVVGEIKLGGEESFDIMICTPLWLTKNFAKEDVIFGKNYLIVFEYNYNRIFNKIKNYVENISGDSWEEIGNKINRIGKWEFEDYIPYKE